VAWRRRRGEREFNGPQGYKWGGEVREERGGDELGRGGRGGVYRGGGISKGAGGEGGSGRKR